MLRRLYEWTMRLAEHPRSEWALAGVSFAESSFFPIPPDVVLAPMIMANRKKTWRYFFICTLSSALGGIFGYLIGMFLMDTVGQWIINLYGLQDSFETAKEKFNELGWLMVLLGGGFTPLPYKVITILSGITQLNFLVFVLVGTFARGTRFLITCSVLYWLGPKAKQIIEKRLGLAFTALVLIIAGGLYLAKYAFH
ncbi:YqaA family protein [Entomomonas asaccharolytica]|uniref:DedA family protein n=1 Tax=Entomomonas asaccharolytica TaxID=2785331 RepID=A0A974RVX9_9GAMM|nr:YqaA family protein [Entomomonas asaccharolytica]QQP84603.1 DedA family protein [Entomomonas asaccharolytica]